MKTILALVLIALYIMPSQSEMNAPVSDAIAQVSDAKMEAILTTNTSAPRIYEKEANSSICINQTYIGKEKISYLFLI